MKYLVSIHRPQGYDHSKMIDTEVIQAIDAVNDEMMAAGVRVFVCGLGSPSSATSIHHRDDGEVMVEDGPFLKTSEYVDGFWVLDCVSQDEAVEWGRKAALACRGSVEVRPLAG